MSITSVFEEACRALDEVLADMEPVSADQFGLDPRAGHELWVDHDWIAVSKVNEANLEWHPLPD
jgi:hypothetical protein